MDDSAFSSIDFVVMCFLDKERTSAFQTSIEQTVKKDSQVLELGTGSGILSMFAARNKPTQVTAVEFDPYIAEVAGNNIRINKLEDIVSVTIADARHYDPHPAVKYDVVIAEMLTTGVVDEFQVQATNNLHRKGLVHNETIFIPSQHDTFVELVEADFSGYGFEMKMVKHIWRFYRSTLEQELSTLSSKVLLNTLDFSKEIPEEFTADIELTPTLSGTANAVLLTSETHLPNGPTLKATEFLNGDVVVPLTQPHAVMAGEPLTLRVSYVFGKGYKNFKAEIVTV